VLAIKADGHESLQSLNGCPRVTDDWAGLRNFWQSMSTTPWSRSRQHENRNC